MMCFCVYTRIQALAQAALQGANLKGLGLPPHIEDPAAAAVPNLPPGVVIDGLSQLPTQCLCFLGMVTAERLKNDEEYNDVSEQHTCTRYTTEVHTHTHTDT
jgi:hypothetical protein